MSKKEYANLQLLCQWDGPVYDAHAHPRGLNGKGELDREYLDRVVEYARTFNITGIACLGEVLQKVQGYTADEIRRLNDRTHELVQAYGSFFLPFCFLDPVIGADFVREEVLRCRDEYGFRHIKLETGCNVGEKWTDPVFQIAGELGFPVLAHTTNNWTIGHREYQSDAHDLRRKALQFPGTKVIMAHLTGCGVRGVREIEDLPNVAVDTSGMQPDAGIIEYAVSVLGPERVIYGSDILGRDFTAQVGQVLGANISTSVKEKILYKNAMAWLQLSDTAEEDNTV
jgi:uncharacterized protein